MTIIKYAALLLGVVVLTAAGDFAMADSTYSNVDKDETIQFFQTSAWFDDKNGAWMVPVHGWVYEPTKSHFRKASVAKILKETYDLTISPAEQDIFSQRVNLLLADNERNKSIVIELAGKVYRLQNSGVNGHFYSVLKLPLKQLNSYNKSIENVEHMERLVTYRAILPSSDNRDFVGNSLLLSSTGLSIISDIDDTVKLTYVTDRRKLIESTFFKKFVEVEGMSERYQHWREQGASLHFVSSSPWQLYAPLSQFLTDNNFPIADFSLKSIRFRDTSIMNLFKKGTETKPAAIEKILARYPKRNFVLVGDSGEQDAAVYADIADKYPDQIERILIRKVEGQSESSLAKDMKLIFSKVPDSKWQVFSSIDEVAE